MEGICVAKKENTKLCGTSTLRVLGDKEKPVRGNQEAANSSMREKPRECDILKANRKKVYLEGRRP